ncbi:sigma-70 family RNA polymerase sigma factor [Bremerella sp.]|uniref:sigma-70 family RNA polymerase sigma factor n=1 Tax=Bremerella sp. TaxID=2795602 RepID=UPI003919E951
MKSFTEILQAAGRGDNQASDQLLPLVYDELRRLAAYQLAKESPGQTLQPTALVHEAYLRLTGNDQANAWEGRRHFFAAAAISIRRILVDNSRRKRSLKRGGDFTRQELVDEQICVLPEPVEDLLALDEALNKLQDEHPDAAQLVQLLYFSGLSRTEAAEILEISPRTVDRLWTFARAWLRREMSPKEDYSK